MKPQEILVLLRGITLCCTIPLTQPLCAREDSCVTIPERDYCKTSTADGQFKPVCPLMEVQLGSPKFETIYIPCCDNRYNGTTRKWYFSRDTKTWKLLPYTNETISFDQIGRHKMGLYRCITSNGNQTVHLTAIDCRKSFDKPEVKLSSDTSYVKADQQNVTFSYHVNFGCDAAERNINIIYHKDGHNIGTTRVPPVVIQGCASDRSVPRICRGFVSLVAKPGVVVSITATACYKGTAEKVSRNFTVLSEVQYRSSDQDSTVTYLLKTVLLPLSVVTILGFLLVTALIRSKLHVTVLSEMTFVMSITGNSKSIGSDKQVYICHCDEDVSPAKKLYDILMTYAQPSLKVVCSADLTGGGASTAEINTIKNSDVVFFIPNYSVEEKVHENIFNSMVQHKNYFRITILDTNTHQNTSCSFTESKLFKRLKHIDMRRDNFFSELQKRLPPCIRRRDSIDSVTGTNSYTNRPSFNHDGYLPGYHIPGKLTYSFPYRHLQTCSSNISIIIPQDMTGEICSNLSPNTTETGSDVSPVTNFQRSKAAFKHILKLTVPIGGNYCPKEVTSPCSAESPDTASTYLSPEIGM
ncbi:uncharacterized protein LOC117342033 [Pecten maximus]|uniref:uncharacterized protein LOC117342033 n=1 Tax=Pecten maximus TaxID=6579 RepID=UPI001458D7CE|nr:uncharacterized protein LOC117342033 [Pecten maximus]